MAPKHASQKREHKTTFSIECETFADQEEAAAKRIKKNPSKLYRIALKIYKSGGAKEKHERKLDKELKNLFRSPSSIASRFRCPEKVEDHLVYLEYMELRAQRLRTALYTSIKRSTWHQDVVVGLYWLLTTSQLRYAVQEAIKGPEDGDWHWVSEVVYRALYRRVSLYIRELRVEHLRISVIAGKKKRASRHPNALVRRAWLLARASELSIPHMPSECQLAPDKFDCTPYSFVEYLRWSKRMEQECEDLFGQAAGILDSGLFHVDFDEILKDDTRWENLELRTKRSMEKEVPKKFRWVESIKPQKSMRQVLLPEKIKDDMLRLAERHVGLSMEGKAAGLTFLFRGKPGTGKSLSAEAIAHEMGMGLLRVNFSAVEPSRISDVVTFFVSRAERTKSVLLFEECENIFRGNIFRGTSDGWAKILFQDFKGVAIFTTNYDLGYGMARRMTYVHEFESETPEIRQEILVQEIRSMQDEEGWEKVPGHAELLDLVSRHEVPGGYFQSVLQLAAARSPQGELSIEALDHAYAQRSKVMEVDKTGIESPKVSLGDVVMKPQQRAMVERIVELARTNRSFHPLLPKCVSAIFHGPPGTGKTLVAEAIAHALGKRIYKATAADLLSMFVGESEKAIRRLFQNAAAQGYVLFIDEAEGLFRDRSAAVRSWELTQVNELLRQFDEFEGIVLLASNHKDAIDPAFARRIQFHVDFPMPSQDERKDLWQKFLGITKIVLEESDLRLLTEGFTLSGGEIRNAVVQAQAHGVTDILRLCEICKGIEAQRFGRSQRRVGLN